MTSIRSCRILLAAIAGVILAAGAASADLQAVGREFRPSSEERTSPDPCIAGDGTTTSLRFLCNPGPGCAWPKTGKLYAEWRTSGGVLVSDPILVAEGHYENGLPYACMTDGALAVLIDYESLQVFDRSGARGPATKVCDHRSCFSGYGITATQNGLLANWSIWGLGFFGRTFDADGEATGSSFLIDGILSSQVGMRTGLLLPGGDVLLAWLSDNPQSIRTAIVRSDGSVVPAVQVNEYAHQDYQTSLVLHPEAPGRFVVAWQNPDEQAGWVARRVIDGDVPPTTTTSTTTTTLDAETAFLPALELGTASSGSDQYSVDVPDLVGDDEGRWLAGWANVATHSIDHGRQWSLPGPFHSDESFANSSIAGNGNGVVVDMHGPGQWQEGHALFVRRSIDGGQTWGGSSVIFQSELESYEYDFEVGDIALTSGPNGTWIAAWSERINYHAPCPEELPDCIDWIDVSLLCAIRYTVSTDDGQTWSEPQLLVDEVCGFGAYPQIANDGNGQWAVVWRDWRDEAIHCSSSSDNGATWAPPHLIVPGVGGWESRVAFAANDDGRWLVAWSQRLFSDDTLYDRIFVSHADDPAGQWSEPAGIAPWHAKAEGRDRFPSLAANENGTFAAAWATHSSHGSLDADIVASFSNDGGETWSAAHAVDTLAESDSRKDFAPRVLANGSAWGVIWRTIEGFSSFSIRFARTRGDCGNGNPDAAEDCDDANLIEGDGCDTTCRFTGCGSHVVTGDEECDDGNTGNTDGCIECRSAYCGDGFVQDGVEECDDANAIDTDDCLNACTLARCGDQVVHSGAETCDDGETTGNNDACLSSCEPAMCGDGYLRLRKEQCDDGNKANGDGCTKHCKLESDCCFFASDGLRVTASDALKVLKRAVGLATACPLVDCDVSRDGTLTSLDSLWTLRSAVGLFGEDCILPTRLVLRMTSSEKFGSLQVLVRYADAAGHIEAKTGGDADCSLLMAPALQSINWDDERQFLRIGVVSLSGIQGPTGLLSCAWDPVSGPSLHDFEVTVEEASDVNIQPLEPLPVVTLTVE